MVRRDKQRGIVDIEHTNGVMQTTDRWLVVKKLLDKASEVSYMTIYIYMYHIPLPWYCSYIPTILVLCICTDLIA